MDDREDFLALRLCEHIKDWFENNEILVTDGIRALTTVLSVFALDNDYTVEKFEKDLDKCRLVFSIMKMKEENDNQSKTE